MVEVVVGFLIAWAVGKTRRVGQRVDLMVDQALDAGLDRLQGVVAAKLGDDPAVQRLQVEAADNTGEISGRTRIRVQLALEEAVEQDPQFVEQLQAVVADVQKSYAVNGSATGERGVVINDGVHGHGSGITIGAVTGNEFALERRVDPLESKRV